MPFLMAKKDARKLFLFGRYSLALLLPKKWLTELGVKRGEVVAMEFDRRRGRIVLRFNVQQTPAKPVADRPIKATERDDLEPIPQIQN